MKGGFLKPDTFSEKRLLGLPPGVNIMLVMYSRFHNYVADVLLKINENGRFTLPPTRTEEAKQQALAKQDEDLFQTARHDWTLDPRITVKRQFDPDGVPRGVGNQVSAEFNLLYRFHSTISQRDEKWMNEFFRTLFPGDKALDQLTPQEFIQGLFRYEQSIPEDPSKREFSGLKRDENGKFNDADLVKIMKESMEDPAGLFGARMVPKALRIIEVTGILTARKWQLASLNEMRDFFKLKRHDTFEDINPDPEIADLLGKLYDHPDMVEMYPGMFLEDAKPRMDPGCGGCPPYTVGRAVFSDAITLVRSDRFLTIDYTASNLTSWGFQEVQQNLDIMGGSMFHKLFQRAFPGWFPYNSLHTTQPMFTRKMNEEIASEIGTIDQFSLADPMRPPTPAILTKHSTVTKVLKDQANFRVPWIKWLNDMKPGRNFNSAMLAGDQPVNTAERNLVTDIMFSPAEFIQLFSSTAVAIGRDLIDRETLNLKKDLNQLDIVRDVAIPLNTRLLADLFALDLKTRDNKNASLSTATLYKHLIDVRTFTFNNNDPGLTLERRNAAREGAEALTESTLAAIAGNQASPSIWSNIPIIGRLFGSKENERSRPTTGSLRWYGHNVVREIIAAGKTTEEAAEISWLTAVGGVGAPIGVFVDVLNFFLKEENSHHWEAIQTLISGTDVASANNTLRQYVLEAQRLTSSQRNLRVCAAETTIDGTTFRPGDAVLCLLGPACMDPEAVPHPQKFKLGRPASAYIHYGHGPRECIGRELTLAFVVCLVRLSAGLKNLRPAPGDMGVLKHITLGTEKCYLNDSWSYLTFDPTTWKVHFDGRGKGVYKAPQTPITAGRDLNALSNSLIQQQKDFVQKSASNGANGDAVAATLEEIMRPIADNANGKVEASPVFDVEAVHQVIPHYEELSEDAMTTVHDLNYSAESHSHNHSYSYSSERDQDDDFTFGLTRGQ